MNMRFKSILVISVLASAWGPFGLHASFEQTHTTSELAHFMQQLQEYKPNAPWITYELLQLSVEDFEQGFSQAIDMFTQSSRRWVYFDVKQTAFDQDRYWRQCLWQCQYYDQWLKKLYVDTDTGELIIKTIQTRLSESACSIFEYWQLTGTLQSQSSIAAVHKLYMFYFDVLAHFFCQSIDLAYKSQDAIELYAQCWSVSKLCLKELEAVIAHLMDTKWYPKYQLMLNRYQEVAVLLEEEILAG